MNCTALLKDGRSCPYKAKIGLDTDYPVCRVHTEYWVMNQITDSMAYPPGPSLINYGFGEEGILNEKMHQPDHNTPIIEEDDMDTPTTIEDMNAEFNSRIYHFLREHTTLLPNEDGKMVLNYYYSRVVTNDIGTEDTLLDNGEVRKSELWRYHQSLITRRPVGGILAMTGGDYEFHLLMHRLVEKGLPFRIVTFENQNRGIDGEEIAGERIIGINKLPEDMIKSWHDKANWAYATASNTVFISFPGHDGWSLEMLDLKEQYVAKLSKRCSELVRQSRFAHYEDTMVSTLREFTYDGEEADVDGLFFISEKLALKTTQAIPDRQRRRYYQRQIKDGAMVRFTCRVMTPKGLVKGDCIVVKDLDVDVLYAGCNIKPEMSTNGWFQITLEPHRVYHEIVYDLQSEIDNRAFLPANKKIADFDYMVDDAMEKIKAGEIPDWMMLGEEVHGDNAMPHQEERLSKLYAKQHIKPQLYGVPLPGLQNIMYMAANSMLEHWEQAKVQRQGMPLHFKKYWVLMSNAFSAPVVTHELLAQAGIRVGDPTKVTHSPTYGYIMPAKRFRETYSLHGGWDQDDEVMCILVKIWTSDVERVEMMKEYGAIDDRIDVPTDANKAVYAMVNIRRPNGPGEWAIELIDEAGEFPWFRFNADAAPVVDLASRQVATPQTKLVEDVNVRGVPTSLEFTHEPMTREQSWIMVKAQMVNPGIGGIAATLMQIANTLGVHLPEELLALLEDMVDTTEQGHDPVAFEAITEEVINLQNYLVGRILTENLHYDGILAHIYKIGRGLAPEVRKELNRLAMPGRFSQFNSHYVARLSQLRSEILLQSVQRQQEEPLVQSIRAINVTEETLRWAKDFYIRYNGALAAINQNYKHQAERSNKFFKMHFERVRTEECQKIIEAAVLELRNFGGVDTHKRVLSLWKFILSNPLGKIREANKMAINDRLICQPGKDESILDLALEALVWIQLAEAPSL